MAIIDLFVNRNLELSDLNLLLEKKTASLVVVHGRRRIGKSRLIFEFARGKKMYVFSGVLPRKDTTAQIQRDEFSRQLSEQLKISRLKGEDWGDLFYTLAQATRKNKVIILFDEISWIGSKDLEFLGKLKNAWDIYFKNNPHLILILCGSVSSWIDKNIINSSAFMGRISLTILLKELSIDYCNQLLTRLGFTGTEYEKFKLLAVTGGVPRYLEEIQPRLSADENIRRLCFKPNGVLVKEFDDIFNDLFSAKAKTYKKIIYALIPTPLEYQQISDKIGIGKGSYLTGLLEDLIKSGFIQRYYNWDLQTAKVSKSSHYRLSDNYLRFYLKNIEPNLNKIQNGHFTDYALGLMPGWDAIMGYQFETLVLNNRTFIYQQLGLKPEEICCDNPYVQRATSRQEGCQIDYLIQTRFNTLFACEIKFSRNLIQAQVIDETKSKIQKLTLPKKFACFPVLIHVNGVSDRIVDSNYFVKVIDFGRALTSRKQVQLS